MSADDETDQGKDHGVWAGVPYDFRRPTLARLRSRMWNPEDRRLFTPKTFGWGYDVNLYWLAHPVRYMRGRRNVTG